MSEAGVVTRRSAGTRRALVKVVAVAVAVACGPAGGPRFGEAPEKPSLKMKDPVTGSAEHGLVVLFATPRGEVAGQPEISVSFNQPMKELGKADQEPWLDGMKPFKIEPELEGEYRWLGSRTVQFAPADPIPQATQFRLTVPEGLRSLAGDVLEEDHEWSFETPPPQVVSVEPYSGERWATPETRITLYFNQAVDPEEVARVATFTAAGEKWPFEVKRRKGDDEKAVVIVPGEKLPLDASIFVHLDEGLVGEEGPIPMPHAWTHGFRTYGPLEIVQVRCWGDDVGTAKKECNPEEPIEFELTNPVPTKDLDKLVGIAPSPKGVTFDKWSASSRWVTVYPEPNWKPGKTYVVELSKKLEDVFGQRIEGKRDQSFLTNDFPPRWTIKFDGNVLESSQSKVMPLSVLNVEHLDAHMLHLESPADVVPVVERMRREGTEWLPGEKGTVSFPLSYPKVKNRSALAKLDLARSKKGKLSSGVVLFRIQNPDDAWDHWSRMVRITDIGLTTKVSGDRVVVWATSLSTGQPVQGAQVSIRDRSNRVLWTGETGADGLASVDGFKLWDDWYDMYWEDRCPYVFASDGGDFTFVNECSYDGISPWSFDVSYSHEAGRRSLRGLVFTERGVYRPGETVEIKGMLRWIEKGRLTVPGGQTFEVLVEDSHGEEVLRRKVEASGYGGVSTEVPLPAGGHLGYHRMSIRPVGDDSWRNTVSGSFDVQEYRAPSFRVDVTGDVEEVVAGDEATFDASGEFLFGAPMAGADVRWYASSSTGWFWSEDWEGYNFDDSTYWSGHHWDDPYWGFTHSGDGQLDATGGFAFGFPTDIDGMHGPVDFDVEATVTGPDLQNVSGRTRIRVHPASIYLGVDTDDHLVASGEEVAVNVVAVDLDGEAVAGRKVKVELFRRQWDHVQSEGMYDDPYGTWKVVDVPAGSCKLVTAEQPASCEMKVKGAGKFVIRVSSKDGEGRKVHASTGIWAWGGGSVSWRGGDEIVVDLHPDKKVYAVGETAKVLVENPFPEAEAIITVEDHGIREVETRHLTDRAALVEIPITDDMRPNVYVSVGLVRGRTKAPPAKGGPDPGKPTVRMGYVNLQVGVEDKVLDVEVKTDRKEYRPGDEVEIELEVTDHLGEGVQSEVTLFVVDEAVLMLTGYKAPDPIGHFYRPRQLGVSNSDGRTSILVRRAFGTDKGETGGGGYGEEAETSDVRQDFRTTAFFEPGIVTDSGGRAKASFTLPDNLTSFRVMAVAGSKSDSFGRGRSTFKVNKPLLLKPAMPRFLRTGDVFEGGVVVHEAGGGAGKVRVTVEASGLETGDPTERTVDLAKGESKLVRFPFAAHDLGDAEVVFRVQGGDFDDAVLVRLPVLLPTVTETVATYGDTTDAVLEGFAALDGVMDDVGGLQVRLASTAFVGLDRAVENLVRYPYGCSEQMTSRLVPMVALGDLVDEFGMDVAVDKKRLVETVRALEQSQHYSGGWGYFAGSYCPYPWLSAYVLWGLHQADVRGYSVDENVMEDAAYFLERVLRGETWCSPMPWWWQYVGLSTKTYIAYVLASVGRPQDSYNDYLYDQRDDLPLFSKMLLAHAIVLSGGDDEQIEELVRDVSNNIKQTPSSAHLTENLGDGYMYIMHSEVRDTALMLDALLDIDPDHFLVSKLARWLMEARREDGTWGNTQNDAWALIAMTHYLEEREAEVPDFEAEVYFAGHELHAATFEGRSLEQDEAFVEMKELLAQGAGTLGFAMDGKGRLYYSASLTYARDSLPEDPIDRGFYVERRYFLVPGDGKPEEEIPASGLDLGEVKAGDRVRVELTIVVTGKRHFVAVEDPLPAGLEIVNFRYATASAQELADVIGDIGYGSGYGNHYSSWYGSPFYHHEMHDDRIVLFADDLQPGIHHYSYVTRATTPGEFVVAPAKAHEMYQPEVFGRTGSGVFEVVP